jgi:hypothetical protein
MKLDQLRKIVAKMTEGPWKIELIVVKENAAMTFADKDGIEAMRNHIEALLEVAECAEAIKEYLPNIKPIGAASHSGHIVASRKLRDALEKLKQIGSEE